MTIVRSFKAAAAVAIVASGLATSTAIAGPALQAAPAQPSIAKDQFDRYGSCFVFTYFWAQDKQGYSEDESLEIAHDMCDDLWPK